MNDQPQYYTPLLEDLVQTGIYEMRDADGWRPCKINGPDTYRLRFGELITDNLRVAYLTPEQIKEEGMFTNYYLCPDGDESEGIINQFRKIHKEGYSLVYVFGICNAQIYHKDARIYYGPCRSINDLRRIMRELNILKS